MPCWWIFEIQSSAPKRIPPGKSNMSSWKVTILARRYIFIHGCLSIVVLVFRGVFPTKKNCSQHKITIPWVIPRFKPFNNTGKQHVYNHLCIVSPRLPTLPGGWMSEPSTMDNPPYTYTNIKQNWKIMINSDVKKTICSKWLIEP